MKREQVTNSNSPKGWFGWASISLVCLCVILFIIGEASQPANKTSQPATPVPPQTSYVLTPKEIAWLNITVMQDVISFAEGNPSLFAKDGLGVIPVSSPQLSRIYEQNEIAADNQFKGKELLVRGRVVSIDKNFMDEPILRLESSNPFNSTMAEMNKNELGHLAQIQKGWNVHLLCEGGGLFMGSPVLKNCITGIKELDSRAHKKVVSFLAGQDKDSISMFMLLVGVIYVADHLDEKSPCWIKPGEKACNKEFDKLAQGLMIPTNIMPIGKKLVEAGVVSKDIVEKVNSQTLEPNDGSRTQPTDPI